MSAVSSCAHRLAQSVLPADIEVVEGSVSDRTACLYPVERASVARAVWSRKLQFSTGRAFAREALERIGYPPAAIEQGPGRAPQWPAGVVGSITHTRGYCAVGVGPTALYDSIGLDVEIEANIRPDMGRYVATEQELADLRETGVSLDAAVAITFSAKEAFYKCQFPMTGRMLDFRDVEIGLDVHRGVFLIRPVEAIPELGDDNGYEGRINRCCGLIATGIVIANRPSRAGAVRADIYDQSRRTSPKSLSEPR